MAKLDAKRVLTEESVVIDVVEKASPSVLSEFSE